MSNPTCVTHRIERCALCILKPGPFEQVETVDPFDAVLEEIRSINRKKRADYATGQDPWSNFKDSGRQVNTSAGTAVEILIATKQSRLRQLLGSGRQPQNEGTRDSLLDRAVYSIIALAMYDEGLYSE